MNAPFTPRVDHQPDFQRFRRHLKREDAPGPVPMAEFLVNGPIIEIVTGVRLPVALANVNLTQAGLYRREEPEIMHKYVDVYLEYSRRLGLDFLCVELDPGIQVVHPVAVQASEPGRSRTWWHVDPNGPIQSGEDFDRFRWPTPGESDYSVLDYAGRVVPPGMKILLQMSGIFELSSSLMGMANFAVALYEQPDLVRDIVSMVGELLLAQAMTGLDHEQVGGLWLGDDLGFNTGTLIAPRMLRGLVFPQYRRLIELAHSRGGLFLLHSCGNLGEIMDDLVRLGVDGKHSFEDKIMPVEEVYQHWGDRLGIIGGVDMDLLSRRGEQEVRRRTREILDVCGLGGGYVLGTGNSMADYVPVENLFAMLDEGARWNEEHFGVPF